MVQVKMLTMDDLSLDGKTVFLRVDMNTPIHPESGELMELSRINEAAMTIRDLEASKVVVASHQGRVGRYDYVPMAQHAVALSGVLNKDVAYVEDVCGPAARDAITNMDNGDVLLLDNLRFLAEETMEFSPEEASKTVFVQRLCKHLDV
ncbi:MAG: phosphoglycerate kinase, partial [Thaumarchaeota archaeon]|nr:phosphoglycerate kinase [Nitrososphaerota archaeon]